VSPGRGAAITAVLVGVGCGGGEVPWGTAAMWGEVPGQPSWEWMLTSEAVPSPPPAVDHLGLDGLDTPAAVVAEAAARGTTAWCYLSVGSWEDWREDADAFVALDEADRAAGGDGLIGAAYDGWPGERWLNLAAWPAFFPLMEARLDRCAAKGFGMVEFDNMQQERGTGFDRDPAAREAYVIALAAAARARGLGPIHKNSADLMHLEPHFDAILMENCALWGECSAARPYAAAGKPVWDAEYPQSWAEAGREVDVEQICASTGPASALLKTLALDRRTVVCAALGPGGR